MSYLVVPRGQVATRLPLRSARVLILGSRVMKLTARDCW